MPSLPLRQCSEPSCHVLVTQGRCQKHRRVIEIRRGTATQRGYDTHHRKLRILCFERDNWKCVDCDWEPTLLTIFRQADLGTPPTAAILEELREAYNQGHRHLHADHEIPIEERPDLRLDLDNLKTRCDRCHNAKTAREDGGFGT